MADRNKGYKYQRSVTAYLASVISKDERVQDYRLFYEVDQLHPFDDIVLVVNYYGLNGLRLYLIQVKAGKINNRTTEIELSTKYLNGYNKIMKNKSWRCLKNIGNVSEENIQCWYFACENFAFDTIYLQKGFAVKELEIKQRIFEGTDSIIKFTNDHNLYELFSKDEDVINKHNFFLNNFYIFLQQPNSYIIAKKLESIWESNDAVQIIEYLDKYFTKNKNGSLSKRDFDLELLKICLSDSIVVPTKIVQFQKESALAWINLSLSYDVTIIKSELDIERFLFGCILQSIGNEITIDQWNDFVDDGGRLSKEFKEKCVSKSFKPQSLKDLLLYYWECAKIPLIIKTNKTLAHLKDFAHLDQHYMIIDSDPDKRYDEMKSYNLNAIKNFKEICANQLLQSIMVSMQGGKPTTLYEVIDGDKKLMEALTCLDILNLMEPRQIYLRHDYMLFIIEMVNPEQVSFEDCEPNGNNIYIYCHLHESSQVYQRIRRDPKFQNYTIYRLQLEDKLMPASRGQLLSNLHDIENIAEPFTFYENNLYKSIQKLETFLVDQHGNRVYSGSDNTVVPIIGEEIRMKSSDYISRHMSKGIVIEKGLDLKFTANTIFPDNDFFKKMKGKICVVTGEAGIGKTTFLQSLRRICGPQYYVLFHNLLRISKNKWKHIDILLQDPLGFLWKMQQFVSYHHFLNVLQKDRKRLILVLDSLDEVIPIYKEQVLELIKTLTREIGLEKIIIGCRLLTVNILREQFDIEVAKLTGFSNEYNSNYMENWSFNDDSLHEMPTEFATNPLYLNMLKEICQTSHIDFPSLTRWTLYERIVDSKLKRYSQRIGHDLDDYEKYNIMRFYWELAVKFIFGSNYVTEKFTLNKHVKLCNFARLGFVKYFNENGEPIFVHHTFAEYFAAKWLIETQDQEDATYIYEKTLQDEALDILRIHCEQLPLHKLVLNAFFLDNTDNSSVISQQIETLCEHDEKLVLQIDGIGRTALHIAAIYYCNSNKKCLEAIIKHMLKMGYDLYLRDRLSDRTWIDYWENNTWTNMKRFLHSSFIIQDTYWSYYASHVKTINSSHIWKNIGFIQFYKSIIRYPDYVNIIGNILSVRYFDNENFVRFRDLCSSLEETNEKLSEYFCLSELQLTPLHLATIYSNINVVIACLKRGDNVNAEDVLGCTPLYYSIAKLEGSIIKLLLDEGANVLLELEENLRFSIFQLSLQKENKNIIKMLIERVDITKCGSIWLYEAIKFGNTEVIEMLLKAGANPNVAVRRNDDMLFETEVSNKNLKEVFRRWRSYDYNANAMTVDDLLLFADTYNNIFSHHIPTGQYFIQPLKVAIHTRRKDVVELLLKYGGYVNLEVNCENKIFDGTPLHCAIKRRSLDIVQLLLHNKADVNFIDKHGLTPLKTAIKDAQTLVYFIDNSKGILRLLKKYCYEVLGNTQFIDNMFEYDWSLNNPVFLQRNLQLIDVLLRHDADVNLNNNDSTPLDDAIAARNSLVIEVLLEKRAKSHNLKQLDFTICLAFISKQHLKLVELFLQNGIDPNLTSTCGVSPLYVAARRRIPEMVTLLIKYGASTNIVTNTKTLWSKAKEQSDFDSLRLLWDLGKMCFSGSIYDSAYPVEVLDIIRKVETLPHINLIEEINTTRDTSSVALIERLLLHALDGSNPLKYVDAVLALNKNAADIALLYKFEDYYKENISHYTIVACAAKDRNNALLKILARQGTHVNSVDKGGRTALVSVIDNDIEKGVVEFLIENQADVNFPDSDGNTPLITAIRNGKTDIVKILLKENAIVNYYVSNEGVTPLIVAINGANLEIIHMLLNNNADVNFASDCDLTPLYAAVMVGKEAIIKLLLNYTPKTNINTCGNTLLFNAVRLGYTLVVGLLLSKTPLKGIYSSNYSLEYCDVFEKILLTKANANAVSKRGSMPLHLATLAENYDMVWKLLDHGADPNLLDPQGQTALHYAVIKQNPTTIHYLLQKKANTNIHNIDGSTPLDYAKTMRNSEIISILQMEEKLITSRLVMYSAFLCTD